MLLQTLGRLQCPPCRRQYSEGRRNPEDSQMPHLHREVPFRVRGSPLAVLLAERRRQLLPITLRVFGQLTELVTCRRGQPQYEFLRSHLRRPGALRCHARELLPPADTFREFGVWVKLRQGIRVDERSESQKRRPRLCRRHGRLVGARILVVVPIVVRDLI
jgi:hypothetical protein